jgi:hypothetical protein
MHICNVGNICWKMCLPGTKESSASASVIWPSEFSASKVSVHSLMSLLCLELCTPGEVSLGATLVALCVGVGCSHRVALDLGV